MLKSIVVINRTIIFVETKQIIMKTISNVSLEKVAVNWTSTKFNTRIVTFTDGGKIKVESLLREIGNESLDNWANINKISKSTSNKNIANYLSNFINKLEICK